MHAASADCRSAFCHEKGPGPNFKQLLPLESEMRDQLSVVLDRIIRCFG